jgi:hypothetical protein
VLTWVIANRFGRRWLGGPPVPSIVAPAAPAADAQSTDGEAAPAGPVQHHCMVCDHKWMKPTQHLAQAAAEPA